MAQPEASYVVSRSDREIIVAPPEGEAERMAIADVTRILIVTNDSGPWGADVWWVFADDENGATVSYPQGATGEDDMLAWLTALPGFDHKAMIDAMACTDNAEFVCWRRDG